MTVELYNKKRDELTELLGRALALLKTIEQDYAYLDFSELEPTRKKIELIAKIVYENVFKILLVAKFQGGKSTSFNAMLGGMCYSPMGNAAIKCSAAPITVQNVTAEDNVGATVFLRTKNELSELLSSAGLECDFSSGGIAEARSVWRERFEVWSKNPRDFDEESRDLMFIVGLVLWNYDKTEIQNLLKEGRLSVSAEAVSDFAKFPESYLTRYSKGGPEAFATNEVTFAFVRKIEIRAKSSELARIGAVLEDCPGLFANSYDTRVTTIEMSDANAVWYLLNAQMPSQSEIDAIKSCLELCKDRLFFSANIKDNRVAKPKFIRDVFPQIQQAVENVVGEEVKIHPYNALAALLYMQGRSYLENGGHFADETAERYLIGVGDDIGVATDDASQVWRALADMCMRQMYPVGLPEYTSLGNPLCEQGVEILKRESHWDEIVGAIHEYVITTKAKSILIVDSSAKALELINDLAKLLEARETAARQAADVVKAKYAEAEGKLTAFERFAKDQLASIDGTKGDMIDAGLSSQLFDRAFTRATGEMAEKAAPQIIENSSLLGIAASKTVQVAKNLFGWLRSKVSDTYTYTPTDSSYAIKCNTIVRNAISDVASTKIQGWVRSVVDGTNATFNTQVVDKGRMIYDSIEREWQYSCSGNELLKAVEPVFPPLPDNMIECTSDGVGAEAGMIGVKLALKEFVKDLIASLVGTYIGGVIFIPGDPVTMAVAALVVMLRRVFVNREAQLKAVQDSMKNELSAGFMNREADEVRRFSGQIAPLRQQVVDRVYEPVRNVMEQFAAAKAAAFRDLLQGQAHRDRIARDCKAIRDRLAMSENGEAGGIAEELRNYIADTEPLC